MADLQSGGLDGALSHAVQFHARERRRSLAGLPELARTHRIYDSATGAIAVATITTAAAFPSRAGPITFRTAIRVIENSGSPGQTRGLILEIGGTTNGVAIWMGDQTIGFHAGPEGTVNGATALFDNGAIWPEGLEIDLVCAVIPGTGRVRMWGNGRELARSRASGNVFSPMVWGGSGNGSFATGPSATTVSDVPAESNIAPEGFQVIEPLSAYQKQVPRHFV